MSEARSTALDNSHIWRNQGLSPSAIARICKEEGAVREQPLRTSPTEAETDAPDCVPARLGMSVEEERLTAALIAKYVEAIYILERTMTIPGAIRRAVKLFITLNGRPRYCDSNQRMIEYYLNKYKHRPRRKPVSDTTRRGIKPGKLDKIFTTKHREYAV